MKILFVTSSLEPKDGWGRYSHSLIKEVSKTNEVFIISSVLSNDKNLIQKVLLDKPVRYLSNPLLSFYSARKIQKVIDSFQPDIIHFLVEPYATVLPFLSLNKKTKVFMTAHGTYSFIPSLFLGNFVKTFLAKKLAYNSFKRLDGIISVSSYTKKHILNEHKRFYGEDFEDKKIKIISNAVDSEYFNGEGGNSSGDDKIKNILFVGAIKKRKGLVQSINALSEYKKKYNEDFIYHIVGNFKENDRYGVDLKLSINKNNLDKNIVFHGKVSEKDLILMYKKSSLYLMLPVKDGNAFEGFGLVYLEANAYGVPCIGSRDSGASDAILDGKTGYLVDPFDSVGVADSINTVLRENTIKPEDCIEWAKKNDIKEKVKEVLDFYINI